MSPFNNGVGFGHSAPNAIYPTTYNPSVLRDPIDTIVNHCMPICVVRGDPAVFYNMWLWLGFSFWAYDNRAVPE